MKRGLCQWLELCSVLFAVHFWPPYQLTALKNFSQNDTDPIYSVCFREDTVLVKSVQNLTFKKAQLHPISHTEFTRTSNAICEQHVGSEYLVWLSMLTLKYWACNHVSCVSVIWNGELACAHLWISMQLAKSVNLCVCVCTTYSVGYIYWGQF